MLKLDNGETIKKPNVVRTVTRSTMISQYMQFCQEEKCEALSRSTLFGILEVREASQIKSLQGLDNTAADGSAGFQMVEMIVDNLEKGGLERQWCTEVKRKLRDAKRYLKTDYCVHCNPEEAALIAANNKKILFMTSSRLVQKIRRFCHEVHDIRTAADMNTFRTTSKGYVRVCLRSR